jgi:hypothetical protein
MSQGSAMSSVRDSAGSCAMAVKKGRALVEAALRVARQHRREVEAKAVDMHLAGPVAQAVHHQLQHARLAQVEAVAGAGPVLVEGAVVGAQVVVQGVVDAAQRQRRAGSSVSALWL